MPLLQRGSEARWAYEAWLRSRGTLEQGQGGSQQEGAGSGQEASAADQGFAHGLGGAEEGRSADVDAAADELGAADGPSSADSVASAVHAKQWEQQQQQRVHDGRQPGTAQPPDDVAGHARPWRRQRQHQHHQRRRLSQFPSANNVVVWSLSRRAEVARLTGHSDAVTGTAFSPASRARLASSSSDGTIRLWNTRSWQPVGQLSEQPEVSDVAWGPDGYTLASSSSWRSGTVALWDTRFGRLLSPMEGHTQGATGVAWAPSNRLLASSSLDATVRTW